MTLLYPQLFRCRLASQLATSSTPDILSVRGFWPVSAYSTTAQQTGGTTSHHVMKAWQTLSYDTTTPIFLNERVQIPSVQSPSEVVIRVHAASLNPIDARLREGYGRTYLNMIRRLAQGLFPLTQQSCRVPPFCSSQSQPTPDVDSSGQEFPLILGRDCSGVVENVGMRVKHLAVGDEVYCAVRADRPGTLAEFVAVDQASVARKPRGLSHIEAASIPYVACTVWAAFRDVGGLRSPGAVVGKRFLIHGASGGIGSFAVELLKAWGAGEVTATCSAANIEFVKSIGADNVVDYTAEDTRNRINDYCPYDFILDPVGTEVTKSSVEFLSHWKGAQFVSLVSPLLPDGDRYGFPFGLARSASTFGMELTRNLSTGGRLYGWAFFRPNGDALKQVADLIEAGKIKSCVKNVIPFAEVPSALQKVGEGHGIGKTVVQII